jgi:hypothetical protein
VTDFYFWLKFLHIVGLAVFLLGHGVSAGASFALQSPKAEGARAPLLLLSVRSHVVAFPGLLVVVVTGVWMAFLSSLWLAAWIWAAIAVLVASIVLMLIFSAPYHLARDILDKPADELEKRLKPARPDVLAWIGGAALLILLFLMIFKPSF